MKVKIKKMPSKKMLEQYLEGHSNESNVLFDLEKGEFICHEDYVQSLKKKDKKCQ